MPQKLNSWLRVLIFGLSSFVYISAEKADSLPETTPVVERKTIRSISISGNNLITQEALLARMPYRIGDPFNPAKTGDLIKNFYNLGYFNNVIVDVEDISDTEVALHVIVEEKKKIESIVYRGNNNLTADEIEKKYKFSEIPAMDENELSRYADQIKQLYVEKNYHAATITTELQPTERGTYIAVFTICEGNKAVVKRVFFKGNSCVSTRRLRELIFTREDWLFGFLSKAGSYQPEMLNGDRYMIENYYQSNGFFTARVVDICVDIEQETQCITVTYTIEEGDLFTVKSVSAPGNDLLTEEQILKCMTLKPGQLYSKEVVVDTIEGLRTLWGRFGYIYADIEPVIIPNFEDKTIEITFNSELGNKITLNRLTICGNNKTREYVIRRMILLCEGDVLTTPAMDISKSRVEGLGFFDPQNGVEWRMNKISENCVDLDLMLKEVKTGKLDGSIGYGGADPQSPATSVRVGLNVSDRNLLGTGVSWNLSASWAKGDHSVNFNVFQPWLFDRPIGAGLGVYHRAAIYEDFKNVTDTPREKLTGGSLQFMFQVPGCPDISTSLTGGVERIQFQKVNADRAGRSAAQFDLYQSFIDRRFISGTTGWITNIIGQDLRNNPVFPNRGYNWSLTTKVTVPADASTFGYVKADFDATWLTPLIGEYDLIFLLHGHAGIVEQLRNKVIPYRELYNMGGPGTVRGFEFGQIGPQVFCSSVGAKKAFWVNAELIFSIKKDQSIRGVVFYDGGAGWDTPLTQEQRLLLDNPANIGALTNNRFRYRHSIGFGIRLLQPAPLRIDWGFKLDRNKRLREKFYEVHFSMSQEF